MAKGYVIREVRVRERRVLVMGCEEGREIGERRVGGIRQSII